MTEFHGLDSEPLASIDGGSKPFVGVGICEMNVRHMLAGGTLWVDLEDGRRILLTMLTQDYPTLNDVREKFDEVPSIRVDRVVLDPNG